MRYLQQMVLLLNACVRRLDPALDLAEPTVGEISRCMPRLWLVLRILFSRCKELLGLLASCSLATSTVTAFKTLVVVIDALASAAVVLPPKGKRGVCYGRRGLDSGRL
eukprot:GHVU01121827.1.p2 GENE.GHVU01121827.1~~GHVU01121827.1.p2  ORF type:complete len:108 (-),score=1.22 GHVU01121827.1:678-1001(-)